MAENKLPKSSKPFNFKKFSIAQDKCAMKVGTDGVLLGAWAEVSNAQNALDIGTGTGVIAIMLAQRNPQLNVDAVEIDRNSCIQAAENMQASPFSERLTAIPMSIQEYAAIASRKFDLIVSNPPFFSKSTLSANEEIKNVRHTTKLTHDDLLDSVNKLLSKHGRFCIILPNTEGLKFIEMAGTYGLRCTKLTEIKPKSQKPPERLLMQFEFNSVGDTKYETLIILANSGRHDYTDEYTSLVKDFYTIL